jgi:hypothetical protein
MAYKFNPFTGNFDDFNGPNGEFTSIDVDGDITIGGTGRVSFPLGLAATPSLYPDTDTNTGIYSPGADQLAVATNGTGRLFIDANGFVGIGAVNTGSTGAQLSTITTSSTARLIVESTNAAGYTGLRVANGTGYWEMQVDGANQGLRWLDDGSERLRITSAGLVGIGTSAPDVVLDVRTGAAGFGQFVHASGLGGVRIAGTGQFSASSLVFANNHSAGVVDGYTIQLDGANQSLKFLSGGTAATARMTLLSDGKVGIGVTGVGGRLHVVEGTTPNIAQLYVGQGGGSNNYYDANNHYFRDGNLNNVISTTSSTIQLFTGGSERARIDTSGRLLVGTSSARLNVSLELEGTSFAGSSACFTRNSADNAPPALNFFKTRSSSNGGTTIVQPGDLLGSIVFRGADGSSTPTAAQISAVVEGTPAGGTIASRLVFSTTASGAADPTERLRITSAGLVGIGSSAPQSKLDVIGTDVSYSGLKSADAPTTVVANAATNTYVRVAGGLYANASSVNLDLSVGQAKNTNISSGWRLKAKASATVSNPSGSDFQIIPTALPTTTAANFTEGTPALTILNTGAVGIGNTAPQRALHVSSAASEQVVLSSTSGSLAGIFFEPNGTTYTPFFGATGASLVSYTSGAERCRVDDSGRLLVGTSTARSNLYGSSYVPFTQFESSGATTTRGVSITYNASTSTAGPILSLISTRGTSAGSNTLVASGDEIGFIDFMGTDGTKPLTGAAIFAQVDGTPGANDMPGRLVFSTTADGASLVLRSG